MVVQLHRKVVRLGLGLLRDAGRILGPLVEVVRQGPHVVKELGKHRPAAIGVHQRGPMMSRPRALTASRSSTRWTVSPSSMTI